MGLTGYNGGGGSGGGGGVPLTVAFATVGNDGTLTAERAITAGTGITITDGGANSTLTWAAKLSTGVAGGQSVVGGAAASENLTLSSTAHGTKGKILFGTSAYDEANNRLGLGTAAPATTLDVVGAVQWTPTHTMASANGSVLDRIKVAAATITLTGGTAVGSAAGANGVGFNLFAYYQPTIAAAQATTVGVALTEGSAVGFDGVPATLYVENPLAGTNVTFGTGSYAARFRNKDDSTGVADVLVLEHSVSTVTPSTAFGTAMVYRGHDTSRTAGLDTMVRTQSKWTGSGTVTAQFEIQARASAAAVTSIASFGYNSAGSPVAWLGGAAITANGSCYFSASTITITSAGTSTLKFQDANLTTLRAGVVDGMTVTLKSGTSSATTNAWTLNQTTVASGASATLKAFDFLARTYSVTGATGITTATGFNVVEINAPTISGDTATCTITNSASLYIAAAPAAGSNVAITNPYAIWVDAGNARLDGNLLLGTGVAGASAANGVLALGNGATAPSDSVDLAQIYAVDISAGNCSLGIRTEIAVVTESVTSDRTLTVKINGTDYKICLKA